MRYLLIPLMVLCTGCHWFVPTAIKREASFMALNIGVAVSDIKAMPEGPEKEKALRTLQRLQPHAVNMDRYMRGLKAESAPAASTVPNLTAPELK